MKIAIVGVGLSGSSLAFSLLHQTDFDFPPNSSLSLFEASDQPGGRTHGTSEGIDLGGSWVWPWCTSLKQIMDQVGVETMEHPGSRRTEEERIKGGAEELVRVLLKKGEKKARERGLEWNLETGKRVERLTKEEGQVPLFSLSLSSGETLTCFTSLFLALPPRIIASSITFSPQPLPSSLSQKMLSQNVWMGATGKIAFKYETPWWRGGGGDKRRTSSYVARIGSNYPILWWMDASTDQDKEPALVAVVGLSGSTDKEIQEKEKESLILLSSRLLSTFSLSSFHSNPPPPLSIQSKMWRHDPLYYPGPLPSLSPSSYFKHPAPLDSSVFSQFESSFQSGGVFLAGSEADTDFPGYLEGAVRAAKASMQRFKRSLREERG